MSADLSVRIGELVLPNPVGVASGTFGYGSEYEALVELGSLGALYTKAITLEPRPGNDVPRIVETPSGLLNSIGLANPGVEAFLTDKLPALLAYPCPVIVNVAGATEAEYLAVLQRIEATLGPQASGHPDGPGIVGYEVNVSCPNVKHGGLAFGTDPAQVERLTSSLRAVTKRCLIVKLTPNVADIGSIARAAEAGGADAVSCINTLVGMAIDVGQRRPRLATVTGGLSGPAILPVGVACVYKASRAVGIPVIGLGGIMGPEDALQYLLAGASAVQVGTGTFVDPTTPARVLAGIGSWMEANSVMRVADIRGMLR